MRISFIIFLIHVVVINEVVTSSPSDHRDSKSSSHADEICTQGGHKCASEFVYKGTTYKHKCAELIGDRTWCLLKHQLNTTEKLQLGVNYDECLSRCPPHVGHINHHIPLWISAAGMFVFILVNFVLVYHLFDKQLFCFAQIPQTSTESDEKTFGDEFVPAPFHLQSEKQKIPKIEIISESGRYRSSDEN